MTIQQPSFTCFNVQCTEFREAGEEEDDDGNGRTAKETYHVIWKGMTNN